MPFLHKKFHFRFSVRALLAATTVLSALFGLVGNEANRLRLHRQSVRKIHELGGRYISITGESYGASWGPWWCPVIRDDLYADSEWVWFTSTTNAGLRDEDLAVLEHLPRLTVLELAAPLITNAAMVRVEGVKTLRELTLYETQVTRAGLRRLDGMPLEKLVLGGPGVTSETLEALEAIPTLRKLWIYRTGVAEAGMSHLKYVPLLEKLILADSPIGDSAMSHVDKLTQLHEVSLIGLPITDEGISTIAALNRLRYLEVVRTQLTDKGLLAFRNTSTLKYLGVGPQSSPDTVKTLTSALPVGCQVFDAGGFRCMQGW